MSYGRAGTSALIEILAECGVTVEKGGFIGGVRGGNEINPARVLSTDAEAYKKPILLRQAEHLYNSGWKFKSAVICLRELDKAHESRRVSGLLRSDCGKDSSGVSLEEWSRDKNELLGKFLHVAARLEAEVRLAWYPKMLQDVEYLHRCLDGLHPGLTMENVRAAFDKVVKPEWVSRDG